MNNDNSFGKIFEIISILFSSIFNVSSLTSTKTGTPPRKANAFA